MILAKLYAAYIRVFRKWRFAHFINRCANLQKPSFRYVDGSWLHRAVTADQLRIEQFLKTCILQHKSILHVGIGNSSFAKQVCSETILIDGITIVDEEEHFANSLNITNYFAFNINKYSKELLGLSNTYDIIIDNNLTSYACCKFHFTEMLINYLQLLKPNGFIVTDKVGLMHYTNGFGMVFTELKDLEHQLQVHVQKVNEYTYLILKSPHIL